MSTMPYKFAVYNHHPMYQTKIDTLIIEPSKQLPTLNVYQIPNPIKDIPSVSGVNLVNEIIPHIELNPIDALIHRNEHGILHCTNAWRHVTNHCLDRGISVMSFDFGYFGHYKHFMVDYYQRNCVSSIYKDWSTLSTILDWSSALPSIQEYRHEILANVEQAKNEQPIKCLRGKKYIVIWAQWTTDLIKHCFYENERAIKMDRWMNRLIDIIHQHGFTAVIKMSPVKVTSVWKDVQNSAICFLGKKNQITEVPKGKFARNINARLIAHADRHIICCSSVSNELLLTDSKITAMGRGWFDNLGVFHEPRKWEDVMNFQTPNPDLANKYANWWLSRQCLKKDVCEKFVEVYEKSRAANPPVLQTTNVL